MYGGSVRLWLQAITVGALVALVVGMVYVLVYVYRGQTAAVSSRALLVECIIPPAERQPPVRKPAATDCYVRSRTEQGNLVGEPEGPLNTVTVAAAACGAAHPGDVAATLACVRKALATAAE